MKIQLVGLEICNKKRVQHLSTLLWGQPQVLSVCCYVSGAWELLIC